MNQPLVMAYICVYVTRNDTRPPSTQGRHKNRGTHPRTHIQGPGKCETMRDGGIQPRGTWTSVGVVVRMGRSLLGRLVVTDTGTLMFICVFICFVWVIEATRGL